MLNRSLSAFALLALLTASGCSLNEQYVPASELTSAQLRSQELYTQSQELLSAHAGDQQMITGLQMEQQTLSQALADSKNQLTTANERVENLLTERSELKDRYASAIETPYNDSIHTNYGLEIPGFEFDSVSGLYRFVGDVQFALGSAKLRPEMIPVLKDFVASANSSEANGNRILIVGHTDDLRIARGSTAVKHATNWHLSTNRADSVIVELNRLGLNEERMAAMGYSKFQPLETTTDDDARQRNRRVELYLIPAGGQIAQWNPMNAIQ